MEKNKPTITFKSKEFFQQRFHDKLITIYEAHIELGQANSDNVCLDKTKALLIGHKLCEVYNPTTKGYEDREEVIDDVVYRLDGDIMIMTHNEYKRRFMRKYSKEAVIAFLYGASQTLVFRDKDNVRLMCQTFIRYNDINP